MHTESNAGFAIAPLESAFYRVSRDLSGDTEGSVHFAYSSLSGGYPSSLPPGVPVVEGGHSRSDHIERIVAYVREQKINFVLAFDLQPISPLYRELRRVGVQCIVSYWGAEISSRKPLLIRFAKMCEIAVSRSRLDGLIFESNAMADLARFGRGVPNRMIDIVPLGIDISRFVPSKSRYVYDQFQIPSDRKIIVYAGHMEPRKGVRFLIEAAIQLLSIEKRDDVFFLIFGNRPGEEEAFTPMYANLGISHLIHFAGYRGDLHLCFPGCYTGVIPSSGWDSFPRTSIEFAASGLPLIVSNLGGLPETVDVGRTGIVVPPCDSKSLAAAIRRLLEDVQLSEMMGTAGRVRCEQNFTLEVQYSRLRNALAKRLAHAGFSGS